MMTISVELSDSIHHRMWEAVLEVWEVVLEAESPDKVADLEPEEVWSALHYSQAAVSWAAPVAPPAQAVV